MEIRNIPLNQIRPYWRNPRKNDETIDKLVKSIKEYGYNVPIVVGPDNVIICGHARFKALMILDYDEVECIVVKLTPEKAKEYRIIDNKTAEISKWDYDLLAKELVELEVGDDFQVYFPDVDLQDLISKSEHHEGSIKQEDLSPVVAEEGISDFVRERTDEDLVELTCPECGNDFMVARKVFMKEDVDKKNNGESNADAKV